MIWLVIAGGLVLRGFLGWERRRLAHGEAALIDPAMLENKLLRGGLTSFFFQYLLQAGLFFAVPLFLSVSLGLSAIETGLRIMPLSVTLLLAAVGVPKFFPLASPRRVVRLGFLALFAGIVSLMLASRGRRRTRGGHRADAAGRAGDRRPRVAARRRHGVGSSRRGERRGGWPAEHADQPGGVHRHCGRRGGADLRTHRVVLRRHPWQPGGSRGAVGAGGGDLAGGVPFIADDQLEAALADVGVTGDTATAVVEENTEARLDGLRTSLSVLAVIALVALFFSSGVPTRQPGAERVTDELPVPGTEPVRGADPP